MPKSSLTWVRSFSLPPLSDLSDSSDSSDLSDSSDVSDLSDNALRADIEVVIRALWLQLGVGGDSAARLQYYAARRRTRGDGDFRLKAVTTAA